MIEKFKGHKIFLASNSPRRREILKLLRLPFTSVSLEGLDESYPSDIPLHRIPLFIAEKKSHAYLKHLNEGDIVITADTMVICDDKIMGKPKDLKEAKEMLHFLSDKTHQVSTGVCIANISHRESFVTVSDVTFSSLSDSEIDYYVDNFHPLDKAGAYGIQEWIGAVAVSSIKGSFYNVMGLPIHQLYKELKRFPLDK